MIAEVFVALFAAHQVADHWIQTHHQATTKGQPGWAGRLACARHVLTYTLTAVLALLALRLPLELSWAIAGLLVSAVTHYWADRRSPLKWLAELTGHGPFYATPTGPYLLDQSWHYGWLFISALIIAR